MPLPVKSSNASSTNPRAKNSTSWSGIALKRIRILRRSKSEEGKEFPGLAFGGQILADELEALHCPLGHFPIEGRDVAGQLRQGGFSVKRKLGPVHGPERGEQAMILFLAGHECFSLRHDFFHGEE